MIAIPRLPARDDKIAVSIYFSPRRRSGHHRGATSEERARGASVDPVGCGPHSRRRVARASSSRGARASGVVPRGVRTVTARVVPVCEHQRITRRCAVPYPKARVGERTDNDAIPSRPSFPVLEEHVLAYWQRDQTFEASVEAREAGLHGANEFVFYDGPPFANGLPHYGHLLTGYVKDVVPRYRTMKGRRVERRFGWDCHGLPAEFEAEKQLGIEHKNEIEAMGVAKFNDACRASVLRYTEEWRNYVTRQARWVDFDHDYKTLDLPYMESVMWAFKTLWDKDLIYEGFRVLWYCWRCETPLINTETKMDDVYRDRQDPAVTVGLRLSAPGSTLDGVLALIWTTTPWTLPSNLAMAVHPDVEYALVAANGEKYLLAAARVAHYA